MADCTIWSVGVAEFRDAEKDEDRMLDASVYVFERFDEACEMIWSIVLDMYYRSYAGSDKDADEIEKMAAREFELHDGSRESGVMKWKLERVGGDVYMTIELYRYLVGAWKNDATLAAMGYRGDDNEHAGEDETMELETER